MKKRTSKVCAVILSAAMISAIPVSAFASPSPSAQASNGGSINIPVDVSDPVISVALPTFTSIAIDPFSVGMATGEAGVAKAGIQLASDEYTVLNGSTFPVKVAYSLDVATESDVLLIEKQGFTYGNPMATPAPELASAGTLDLSTALQYQNESVQTAKEIFFGVVAPTTIGLDPTVASSPPVISTYSTYSAVGGMIKTDVSTVVGTDATAAAATPVAGEDGTLSFAFALKPTKADADAATDPTVFEDEARFKFYAQMNTYADWKDDDITVKGIYELSVLPDTFTTSANNTTLKHGFNMYAVAPFNAKTKIDVSGIETATGVAAAAVQANYYFGNLTKVTAVTITDSAGDPVSYTFAPADFDLTTNAGKLTIGAPFITALQTALGEKVTVTLTLTDGLATPVKTGTCVFKVNVAAAVAGA